MLWIASGFRLKKPDLNRHTEESTNPIWCWCATVGNHTVFSYWFRMWFVCLFPGRQVVLPVWHGERRVPEDGDPQPRQIHLGDEVQAACLADDPSVSPGRQVCNLHDTPLSLLETERTMHFVQSSVEADCMNVFVQDELSHILIRLLNNASSSIIKQCSTTATFPSTISVLVFYHNVLWPFQTCSYHH